ncbi:hypothetical protein K474DRAFT_938689 [Panus rudis PR-1116 ss-1]|nr:hypothetical protein K474DRAFT_938689 [Panus rudis PR-1116 ss-1]
MANLLSLFSRIDILVINLRGGEVPWFDATIQDAGPSSPMPISTPTIVIGIEYGGFGSMVSRTHSLLQTSIPRSHIKHVTWWAPQGTPDSLDDFISRLLSNIPVGCLTSHSLHFDLGHPSKSQLYPLPKSLKLLPVFHALANFQVSVCASGRNMLNWVPAGEVVTAISSVLPRKTVKDIGICFVAVCKGSNVTFKSDLDWFSMMATVARLPHIKTIDIGVIFCGWDEGTITWPDFLETTLRTRLPDRLGDADITVKSAPDRP